MLAATAAFRYHDLMARDRIGSGFDEPLGQTTAKRSYGARGFGLSTHSPGIVPSNPEFLEGAPCPQRTRQDHDRPRRGRAAARPARIKAPPTACSGPTASPSSAQAKIAAATASMKMTRDEKAAGR